MTNFIVQQGTDGGYQWPVKNDQSQPVNLTGWSAKLQIRDYFNNKLLSFSQADQLVLTSNGTVTFYWSKALTNMWFWSGGYYQITITDPAGSNTIELDQGFITISKGLIW